MLKSYQAGVSGIRWLGGNLQYGLSPIHGGALDWFNVPTEGAAVASKAPRVERLDATILDYFEAIHEGLSDVAFICKTAADVQREIDWFIATRTQQLERFGEHRQEAERVIEQTIRQMRKVHADRVEREALEAENEALREQLRKKVVDSTMLTDVVIKNGSIDLGLEGGACALLAEAFASQFKDSGAENYLGITFTSTVLMPGESFLVTLQRQTGKTPHQLRLEAEARIVVLERELAALKGGAR